MIDFVVCRGPCPAGMCWGGREMSQAPEASRWPVTSPKASLRELERRRSERLLITVPIRVEGVDRDGEKFSEDTRTLVINRQGARICLKRLVAAGATLLITTMVGRRSAKFRVVGPTQPLSGEGGEWGVECLHLDKNIWDIYFPPASEDSDARVLLSCRNCHSLSLQSLSLVEVEVLETAGLLTKPCVHCGDSTPWGYSQRGFEVESKAYQAAVRAATSGVPPLTIDRRKSDRKPAQLPVRIRDYYGEIEIAQTENISQEGFCFSSARKYLVGQGIVVICPFDAVNEKPEVRARIVRAETEGEQNIYGVHYDQPPR